MTHAMPCASELPPVDRDESARLASVSVALAADRGWLARMWLEQRKERDHAK